jgi:predicted HAD superfamily Cof-like phosphohydrolase
MSIFTDQATFMEACDQTTGEFNESQYNLYYNLIKEEVQELTEAFEANDKIEVLDGLMDIIVVCSGMLHSGGFDAEGAWNEVIRSNMSKIDAETGKVLKRADGKVQKPISWSPPDLTPYIKK